MPKDRAVLAETYPFDRSDLSALIDAILDQTPDFGRPGIPPALVSVLRCLLTKDPQARYDSADLVIHALGEALGQPLPPETPETRESFLQAARFVGRETEMARLTAALSVAWAGQRLVDRR